MKLYNTKNILLCEKYWAKQLNCLQKNVLNKETVENNRQIHKANMRCILTDCKQPSPKLDQYYIKNADIEFKQLKPSNEDMIFWRGINKETSNGNKIKSYLYNKLINLKKNDTYVMRNYAFASKHKDIAETFRIGEGEEGIIIKMLVPRGAQYSKTWYEVIFPRYSKWTCLKNEKMGDTTFVELKYNLPEK